MTNETLLAVVLGGLGGALASQAIQAYRDRAQALARVRSASQAIRAEVSMNGAIGQIIMMSGSIPSHPRWPEPSRARFDRLIEVLVAELPRNEVTALLGFDVEYPEFERIARDAAKGPVSAADLLWLRETWWKDAQLCQMLLDLRGSRLWDRATHRRLGG